MICLLASVLAFSWFLTTPVVQTPPPSAVSTQEQALHDAVALVDAGSVDGGIEALKAVLAAEPGNRTASYELGLAYSMKGDSTRCQATLAPLADERGRLQVPVLGMLGTCTDQLGDRKKAIELYRQALAISPEDAGILFNLALSLVQSGDPAAIVEARSFLKRELHGNPSHATSHLLLAKLFESGGFRVPALLSYVRFLALEPGTPRAKEIAAHLRDLSHAGVKRDGNKVNVTIDPSASKEEGDYASMDMLMALLAGAEGATDRSPKPSEFEAARGQLESIITIFIETDDAGTDYTAEVQRPFFKEMQKAKVLEPFTGYVLLTLDFPGAKAWREKNSKAIDSYLKWIQPRLGRKPVLLLPSSH